MKTVRPLLLLFVLASQAVPAYERVEQEDVTLLFDWRGEFTAEERVRLQDWQMQVMATMRLLHGDLPRDPIRIALQPYRSRGPVPFALVLRNEPEGILFYVDASHSVDEFVRDWTAYHEYTHLFIPYPGMRDVWFSEGLASYYQNILQFRAGLLTSAEARTKLRNGFERGLQDSGHGDMKLADLSWEMRERRAFMRVYWSGALYFLEADVRLRRMTGSGSEGPGSVDAVLAEFNACCMSDRQRWRGRDIARAFDEIVGTPLFLPLFEEYAASYGLPDYAEWLERPEMDAILPPENRAAALPVE